MCSIKTLALCTALAITASGIAVPAYHLGNRSQYGGKIVSHILDTGAVVVKDPKTAASDHIAILPRSAAELHEVSPEEAHRQWIDEIYDFPMKVLIPK